MQLKSTFTKGSEGRIACRAVPIGRCSCIVASLVPKNMPLLVERPESLPQQQPLFDFFDINSINQLMFPDIVAGIDNVYNGALLLSFIVVCFSFEGLELLREFNSDREYSKLQELLSRSRMKKKGDDAPDDTLSKTNDDVDALRQRRRGLGWLALITFIAVWSTGVLNSPNPLQP